MAWLQQRPPLAESQGECSTSPPPQVGGLLSETLEKTLLGTRHYGTKTVILPKNPTYQVNSYLKQEDDRTRGVPSNPRWITSSLLLAKGGNPQKSGMNSVRKAHPSFDEDHFPEDLDDISDIKAEYKHKDPFLDEDWDIFGQEDLLTSISRRKSKKIKVAQDNRKYQLLAKALDSLYLNVQVSSELHPLYRQSLLARSLCALTLHRDYNSAQTHSLKQVVFTNWRKLLGAKQLAAAQTHSSRCRTLAWAFQSWRTNATNLAWSRQRKFTAEAFMEVTLLKKTLLAWRRDSRGEKLVKAFQKHWGYKKVLSRLVKIRKIVHRICSVAEKMSIQKMMKSVMVAWRLHIDQSFYKKLQVRSAEHYRPQKLLLKGWQALKASLGRARVGKTIQRQLVERIAKQSFIAWRSALSCLRLWKMKEVTRLRSIFKYFRTRQARRILVGAIIKDKHHQISQKKSLQTWRTALEEKKLLKLAGGFGVAKILRRSLLKLREVASNPDKFKVEDSYHQSSALLANLVRPTLFSVGTDISQRPTVLQDAFRQRLTDQSFDHLAKMFTVFKGYWARKRRAMVRFRAVRSTQLEGIFEGWRTHAKESRLNRFKGELIEKERARKVLASVWPAFCNVIRAEKAVFRTWQKMKLLQSSMIKLQESGKVSKRRKELLRALMLRQTRRIKREAVEVWSEAISDRSHLDYLEQKLLFLSRRIALSRLIRAYEAQQEMKLEEIAVSRKQIFGLVQRSFSSWAGECTAQQATVLQLRLCLRRLVRNTETAKRLRAATWYSNAITQKKAFTSLQVSVLTRRRLQRGLETLAVVCLSRRLQQFFGLCRTVVGRGPGLPDYGLEGVDDGLEDVHRPESREMRAERPFVRRLEFGGDEDG